MNPFSPLPSFYEMMLIEEAQRSAQKALKDGLDSMAHLASQQRTHGSSSVLRKLINRLLHFVEFLVKKYGPEVRFLITYLIERRCIAGSSATMSESIYGGMRVKVRPGNLLEPMTPHDKTRLTMTMTLSWYIDEKMEDIYQKWKHSTATCRPQFQVLFVKVYPYLRMTQNGTVLAYQFLYLLGKSVYFHPLSHLLRIAVRRLTHEDVVNQISVPSPSRTNRALQKWIPTIRRAALWVLSSTAIVGWLHQFRQHIRQQEQLHRTPALNPPPPPPPPFKLDPRHRIRIPESSDVCPLCQQPWIAPTASRSGFVFCHKCLVLYVRDHGMCPLTGIRCTEQDLIRIYEPQASAA